jgi:hypothetical protein
MSTNEKAECRNCVHFRSAPYEARVVGCYLAGNMESKQSARYLDEQQLPGNHDKINRNGDCPDYQAREVKAPWWQRILRVGA